MGKPTTLRVFDANLIYLLGSLLFFTIGFTVQQRELYTGLVITQLAVVLLPPFLYLEIRRMNVRHILRFNPINWRQGVFSALITIFMYPAAVTANLVMLNMLGQLGNLDIPQIPAATTPFEFLRLVIIVSLLAGFCEEIFFRGLIMRGYERLGSRPAVIISAVLFGIFHYNIYNLFGAVMLGIVFGSLVMVTNSIYAGVIGHIINNGLAITLGYIFTLLSDWLPPEEIEMAQAAVNESLRASLLFFSVMALAGMTVSYFLYKKLKGCQGDISSTSNETVFDESGTDLDHPVPGNTPAADQRNHESRGKKLEDSEGQTSTVDMNNQFSLQQENTEWWEYFPLTGVIPLFVHVMILQITMIIG